MLLQWPTARRTSGPDDGLLQKCSQRSEMSSGTCEPKQQREERLRPKNFIVYSCVLTVFNLTPPFAHGSRSPLEKIMLLAVERAEHKESSLETTLVQIDGNDQELSFITESVHGTCLSLYVQLKVYFSVKFH